MLNAHALPEVLNTDNGPHTPNNPTPIAVKPSSRVSTPGTDHGPTFYYSKKLRQQILVPREKKKSGPTSKSRKKTVVATSQPKQQLLAEMLQGIVRLTLFQKIPMEILGLSHRPKSQFQVLVLV